MVFEFYWANIFTWVIEVRHPNARIFRQQIRFCTTKEGGLIDSGTNTVSEWLWHWREQPHFGTGLRVWLSLEFTISPQQSNAKSCNPNELDVQFLMTRWHFAASLMWVWSIGGPHARQKPFCQRVDARQARWRAAVADFNQRDDRHKPLNFWGENLPRDNSCDQRSHPAFASTEAPCRTLAETDC